MSCRFHLVSQAGPNLSHQHRIASYVTITSTRLIGQRDNADVNAYLLGSPLRYLSLLYSVNASQSDICVSVYLPANVIHNIAIDRLSRHMPDTSASSNASTPESKCIPPRRS